MRLLVAEADTSLAEFLQTRLQQEHFAVQLASTGDQISKFGEKSLFDLILLDLNLPGVPGPDYLRHLQSRWPEAPVVLLSSASSVEERIKGLDAGADDIIMKPFAWSELAARIRAVLRRRNRPSREVFQYEDLEVNGVSHEVRRAGRPAPRNTPCWNSCCGIPDVQYPARQSSRKFGGFTAIPSPTWWTCTSTTCGAKLIPGQTTRSSAQSAASATKSVATTAQLELPYCFPVAKPKLGTKPLPYWYRLKLRFLTLPSSNYFSTPGLYPSESRPASYY